MPRRKHAARHSTARPLKGAAAPPLEIPPPPSELEARRYYSTATPKEHPQR